TIQAWVGEVRTGLQRTGLRAVVNLNCRTPPPWAVSPAGGLFPPEARDALALQRAETADSLLNEFAADDCGPIRMDWHVCEQDFAPPQRPRLLHVCEHIRAGIPIALVPDRPRRTVALAEGLDREHPAVFAVVGLRLDSLARYVTKTTG